MWVTMDGGHTRPPVRDGHRPADEPADLPYQHQPPYHQTLPYQDEPAHEPEPASWRPDAPHEPVRPRQPDPPRWLDPGSEPDPPAGRYRERYHHPSREPSAEPSRDGPSRRTPEAGEHQPQEPQKQHDPPPPRKLTVTRVIAWRGRQLTGQGIRAFQRAAGADGADRSGLRALTYATMLNYANDAAIAVALANTLFFSAATAESRTKVALYLLITVAPFALVAPVIGPLLDRVQRGRRAALAASFLGRAVLTVVMALHFNDWGLYPAALGVMVLSKSFTVLRAAVTPRVLPEKITLVTTNSRLTVFGMLAGAVFGAIAVGVTRLAGSPGALVYTAALCLLGAWLCARIPGWVEVTEGEVPAALGERSPTTRRQPMGQRVAVALWANSSIRLLTGFLTLFVAFAVKAETEREPARQLVLLGIFGAAAGIGAFVGNAVGSRQRFARSDLVVFGCVGVAVASAVAAAVLPGIVLSTVCAFVASTASALAKVCLDAVIQRDLPERSRASAFGRSETFLQLAWVFGGAMGVLLPPTYWIGFSVAAAVAALVGGQAMLISKGASLLPWIRHREPPMPPGPAVQPWPDQHGAR
jgi:MFS family permease